MPSAPTVAVVGAGLAGAACARVLATAGIAVELHDRGRLPGGRMASSVLDGRPVDLGASYFTVRDDGFRAVVDDWLARGLVRPWTDAFHVAGPHGLGELKQGPLRYGTGGGLRSLVLDLLQGLDVRQSAPVRVVGPGPRVDGRSYDAVVLALPDPQAAALLEAGLVAEGAAVRDRPWEPVLALAVGYEKRCWTADFDGCFVQGADTLGWVADDGRRRGDGAAVLVAHSTSPFAAGRLQDPAAAEPELLDALQAVLDIDAAPQWTHVQRWSWARPVQSRSEPFHLGATGVGPCGDGWGSPRVETAWLSGTRLGEQLVAQLS